MAKKKKVKVDRIIILVLAAILILGAFGFGLYKLFGLLFADKQEQQQQEVIPNVETVEDVKLNLKDYVVYIDDTDELGFSFVVAKINFKADKNIQFDLNDLQTSEKISLGSVNKYKQILTERGYSLDELKIDSYISAESNDVTANIFIPYKTGASSFSVYNSKNPATNISFDLDKNNKIITSLKFDTEENIVIDNTSVRVESCFISTIMKHNDEEYEIPSSIRIFTFIVCVDSVDDNVSITDAYFIKDGDSEDQKIEAMSSDYRSINEENIIGKKLTAGKEGALFFEGYSRDEEPNYAGSLMIKFSNSEDWVKISTKLN